MQATACDKPTWGKTSGLGIGLQGIGLGVSGRLLEPTVAAGLLWQVNS